MKKLLILSALLAAAAACTENNPGQAVCDKPVIFATPVVSRHTKAYYGEMSGEYSREESFRVYGVFHSGNFTDWDSSTLYIDGDEFSYSENIDDYSEGKGGWTASSSIYLWPGDNKMTFAAYSPSRAREDCEKVSYGSEGLHLEGFEIASEADMQYDLLYSKRAYNKTSSTEGSSTTYDGVDIEFQHALSSIRFTARCDDGMPDIKIRISKIIVYGIYGKGNFDEHISGNDTYTSDPQWTDFQTMLDEDSAYIAYHDESEVLTSDTPVDTGRLLLLPQGLENAQIEVYYTMQYGSNTPVPTKSSPVELNRASTKEGVEINSWEMGRRYTYNLVLGAQKIRFSVDVKSWMGPDDDFPLTI